jgi:hypothetical protein
MLKAITRVDRQCILSEEQFNQLGCIFEQIGDLVEMVRTHAGIESARGPAVTCLNLILEKAEQADKITAAGFAAG